MPRSQCRVCGSPLSPAEEAARCPACGTDRPTHWPCSRCGYDLAGATPRFGLATCPECGLENASGLPPRRIDGAPLRWAGIALLAVLPAMLVPQVGFPLVGAVLLMAVVYALITLWRRGWSSVWGAGPRGGDPPA